MCLATLLFLAVAAAIAAAAATPPALLGAIYHRPANFNYSGANGADEFLRDYRKRFGQLFELPANENDTVGCGDAPCWRAGKYHYCLPTTYVIGVRKCGTSSMHDAVSAVVQAGKITGSAIHADDGVSLCTGKRAQKETHFLSSTSRCVFGGSCEGIVSTHCGATDAWTHRRDPLVLWTSMYQTLAGPACKSRAHYVESSPEAITQLGALAALARILPRTARYIIILRHPPSRAWSDFLFTRTDVCSNAPSKVTVRDGLHIYGDGVVAFNCSLPAIAVPAEFSAHVRRVPKGVCSLNRLILGLGCYYFLIKKLPVNALVLRIEDWHANPTAFGHRLATYVGHGSTGSIPVRVHVKHVSHGMLQSPSIPQATACLLEELYTEPNARLAGLLGNAAFEWPEARAKAMAGGCTQLE
ncbi:P-loop containing nucleoside triphosphate hydrolase protein [Pavlovales sp. CCMP2436]|nr:P-loop containing nucleoside triphosphate hydrolase protein [Pavlovales sp. CCMP2436]